MSVMYILENKSMHYSVRNRNKSHHKTIKYNMYIIKWHKKKNKMK